MPPPWRNSRLKPDGMRHGTPCTPPLVLECSTSHAGVAQKLAPSVITSCLFVLGWVSSAWEFWCTLRFCPGRVGVGEQWFRCCFFDADDDGFRIVLQYLAFSCALPGDFARMFVFHLHFEALVGLSKCQGQVVVIGVARLTISRNRLTL